MKQYVLVLLVAILVSCSDATSEKVLNPTEKIEKLADIPYSSEYSVRSPQKMHIDGDKLIVCTNMGLYAIDLNAPSIAEPFGFDGIPVADFVKSGSTILARRGEVVVNGNVEDKLPYAYISHDNGKTYKEFHPESMHLDTQGDCWSFIDDMVQNPHNDKEILVLNMYGLWKSTDFGTTWTQLTHTSYENISSMEYFPHDMETFMYHGSNMVFEDQLYITRDGGKSWESVRGIFHGDNHMYRMAFHPTDPNVWAYGGQGCIGMTEDKGHTFNLVWDVYSDEENCAGFCNILFDQSNPDIIFASGEIGGGELERRLMRVVGSCDRGKTWKKVAEIPIEQDQGKNKTIDMIQTDSHLYLMNSNSKVYRILKKDMML